MTSPYSSTLLNDAPASPAPRPRIARRTLPSQPAPMPAYAAPTPMQYYAQQPAPMIVRGNAPSSGGRAANLLLALVVLLVTVVAAVAGYVVARNLAPTPLEMDRYQTIAAHDGYQSGQLNGLQAGKQFARANNAQIVRYKALIARQKAWNQGYRQGKRTGLSSGARRRSYGSGYGYRPSYGYSRPRSYSTSGAQVASALSSAQALANRTGAPVDVEIY